MDTIAGLDVKDRKILFALEQDSGQSLSQLARKVGLRKETIFHRMKRLEQRGIIKAYITEINVCKLGYQFYPMLLRFQDTTPAMEREIYRYFQRSRYIAWLTRCEGAWDIACTLIAPGNATAAAFLEDFTKRYGSKIAEKRLFITTKLMYFRRSFDLKQKSGHTVQTTLGAQIPVDADDLALLRILAAEARKPLVEIGQMLGSSPKQISYRIRKLERIGVIQGSRILVDFAKIGYKFYKVWFMLKNHTDGQLRQLLAYCQFHPSIIWATRMLGSYDLSIEMEVRDVREFRAILDEIKAKFSPLIKRHESLLIFEESVMNYLPADTPLPSIPQNIKSNSSGHAV